MSLLWIYFLSFFPFFCQNLTLLCFYAHIWTLRITPTFVLAFHLVYPLIIHLPVVSTSITLVYFYSFRFSTSHLSSLPSIVPPPNIHPIHIPIYTTQKLKYDISPHTIPTS
ncbi:hypothetical protein K435DRAFT_115781 [Dendrothele bispora CBS 962.96]|uniref:Uncharacterized protein n=1 Tax=Dendrothele bispora (strain CBS 962.96) TaxID=1314807 RepID=A0A4S8MK65_DENBC|nr:hypothetical protein K435DRAFT_311157 [Dendrothele bispora CBS 962.96]THV05178.1 hypothetical protein K435DRAFT_115781 [Dendrothele bispora CBS 962.96]